MAFKTRTGQTAAVGHGTMTGAVIAWWTCTLLLLAPLAVLFEYIVWLTWPDQRSMVEDSLPVTMAYSVMALSMILVILSFLSAPAGVIFAGPSNGIRARVRMLAGSHTMRWCTISGALVLALLFATRFPFANFRPWAIILMTLILTGTMLAALRGLLHIYRRNRSAPFFAGMSEAEQKVADSPLSKSRKPSFPEVSELECGDEADRYARRARSIATIHVWIGATIIIIFSAFIGTTLTATWESTGPGSWISVYLVLGMLALGFWIQRRARDYEQLSKAFEQRAREIRTEHQRRRSAMRRMRDIFNFGRRAS